ncbi:MAG: amylo-alpha-1,6-glucosidase [Bacteroidales bacterium]|nr:amylo-alpha-1,6-glucosidase [Bacteroidales bacterium]
MEYLKFDKSELINLEYSLSRETLRSNRAGSFASSTLTGCNTRKYHGLLVCPMEHLDDDKHVLLSSMDCSVEYGSQEFELGIHKYEDDIYHPKGHKFIQDFNADVIPVIYYRIGEVRISREILLVEKEQQLLIRYTILESDKSLNLKFRPFLAFRNMHHLTKANMHAHTKVKNIENGVKYKMYDGYPYLHMQFSVSNEFVSNPDWFYNVEYSEEKRRGYDYKEDLFVPGFFELKAKKGDVILFSASTSPSEPAGLKRKFTSELNKRTPRDSFRNCLENSAEQFFVANGKKVNVIAGFPWFGAWGRDTFIALPGLCFPQNDTKTFLAVVDTMIQKVKGGLFPNMGGDDNPAYNTVDASMWFIWAMQQYCNFVNSYAPIWKKYKKTFVDILESYKNGTLHRIHMLDNGLIFAGEHGKALTWMDAVVMGKAITPRIGCNVEINALWFNNISFCLDIAKKAKDDEFVKQWKDLPAKIGSSLVNQFWSDDKKYLADYIDEDYKDWAVRPNQVIATAMEYSPLTDEMKKSILEVVRRDLLTPYGLRTLAPRHPDYKGVYEGSQEERDNAYHQGTVWPWPLEHFVEGWIKIYKKDALPLINKIVTDMEPTINDHGIGAISEIYDGNPPFTPRGAISQAWSVSAMLSILDKQEKLNTGDE